MVLDVGGDEVGYCASEGCEVGFECGSEGDGGEDCEAVFEFDCEGEEGLAGVWRWGIGRR